VLRWRPSASQVGDWTLRFTAVAGGATAPALTVYVHVGRRAARTFGLSSVSGRSQTATLLRSVSVRAGPTDAAPVVTRLHRLTPEHVRHVVYLLAGTIGSDGRYWLRVQLPILPNGSSGWIPRDAVTGFSAVDTHLVIDRSRFRVTLFRRGRPVFRSIIGVGQPRWPTPAGRFYVRERLTGFTDPIYGAIAFGTNGRSAVLTDWPGGGFIGIHGTNRPGILPGRVSHGCVRLPNPSIRRLDRLMRVGTPVTIR
jgi:lipoprotein-anchoring transpeptidase ErfK/SrfK